MPLPSFYVDNVSLKNDDTISVRGNRVSDIKGINVVGINVHNCANLRMKNNQVSRLREPESGISTGYIIQNCDDALLVYNSASRCKIGFFLTDIAALSVYNLTAHDCVTCIKTTSSGIFRNIALSSGKNWYKYKQNLGIQSISPAIVDLDYTLYHNLGNLFSGSVVEGDHVFEKEILYFDEAGDDLTPDYISELVNTGMANPLKTLSPDIGGIESAITTETTAERDYHYTLIDNAFWDVENDKSIEVSFIKSLQSRILANNENAAKIAAQDYYLKTANSLLGFSELFPANAIYVNQSKFQKRIIDLWYATQNPATLSSYNGSIGGYNLFPSFFQRMEDSEDAWIIAESVVDEDNWLFGYSGIKYGILIDVLGTSTLSQSTSGECYTNVQNCISDIAPVRWNLHDEAQPDHYILFTDMHSDYELCTLTNMVYDDDFAIQIDTVQTDGEILTPLIPTASLWASGIPTDSTGASGLTEISLLDRNYSENVIKKIYYRQGVSGSLSSWSEIRYPISGYFSLTEPYVQFKITVSGVLRKIDYEFIGLCLRAFKRARDWSTS